MEIRIRIKEEGTELAYVRKTHKGARVVARGSACTLPPGNKPTKKDVLGVLSTALKQRLEDNTSDGTE